MSKKLLLTIASAVVVISLTPSGWIARSSLAQGQSHSDAGYDPAIAFVDMNRVFMSYEKTREAEAIINDHKAQAEKADEALASAHKSAREIRDAHISRQKQLQAEALQMRADILKQIAQKIWSLGGVENIILDKAGNSLNGVPVFMFSPDRADMTQRVTDSLNQNRNSAFDSSRDLQFAVVDMNKIFRGYKKTKDGETKVNEAKDVAKREYDERVAMYKKEVDRVNKTSSGPIRETAIRNLKKMEAEINDWRTAKEKQLEADAVGRRSGIVADITEFISNHLADKTNCVVVDISGAALNGAPIIIYANRIPDLSDSVILTLNQSGGTKQSFSFASSHGLRFGTLRVDRALNALPGAKRVEEDIAARRAKAEHDLEDPKTQVSKEKELRESATKAREPLVRQIKAALAPVAEQGGFNFVIDSSGSSLNGVPILVAGRDIPDLTDEVVDRVGVRQ